jgi:hypothetical protein
LQKGEQSLAGFFQRCRDKPGAGDQDQIQAGCDAWEEGSHRFPKEAFGAISINRCSHRSTCRHSDLYARLAHRVASLIMRLNYQHNKRVGIGLAGTPHPLEVFGAGQTELSLHPNPRTCSL